MKVAKKIVTKIFDLPFFYELFQRFVKKAEYDGKIRDLLDPKPNTTVIDFGCGIGQYSKFFQGSNYLGIDPLFECIEVAKRRYSNNQGINFTVGDETFLKTVASESVDTLFGIGVLHHMDNQQVVRLMTECARILRQEGKICFVEPYFYQRQPKIRQIVMRMDRGQRIRSLDSYLQFIDSSKFEIRSSQLLGALRIPYDLLHISCKKK